MKYGYTWAKYEGACYKNKYIEHDLRWKCHLVITLSMAKFSCDSHISGSLIWGNYLVCITNAILWYHSYMDLSNDAQYGGYWIQHESYGDRGVIELRFITLIDRTNISLFFRRVNS